MVFPYPAAFDCNADSAILGAVGISGDTSDNDEAAAIAAIEAVGLIADTGA